ncbi:MAG: four-carbon acid sugar kinase family protein [Lachnospiraceae bacterium]|nr:four-carbon acid sugar kinase family protein [Lachnospiraceae bacterium]
MPEILIIADDLTGANDTGVMIAQQGVKTCTILDLIHAGKSEVKESGCLSYSTDSRGSTRQEAYSRVYQAVEKLKSMDIQIYSKRIDSTLRGNLGAEMDAMLDCLGDGRMAVIVPSFPQAGRIYIQGQLLVNGIPLYRTAAASDPKNPIHTASALDRFRQQSRYPIAEIYLNEIEKGTCYLADRLAELYQEGIRGIIFDAVSDQEFVQIAEAVIRSRIPFITVDPGSFTARMVSQVLSRSQEERAKVLFAVGSVNEVASRQTQKLIGRQDVGSVVIDTSKILEGEEACRQEIDRVSEKAFMEGKQHDICCIYMSGIFSENRMDLEACAQKLGLDREEVSGRINELLAETAVRVLKKEAAYKGLFCCGGDAAVAVCKSLDAHGIFPLDEVVPLMVYGLVMGGQQNGMHIITKGGMIGDDDTMCDCIMYFKNKFKEREYVKTIYCDTNGRPGWNRAGNCVEGSWESEDS